MAASIYVPLPAPTRAALVQLAEREYRRPKDQARLLLEEALRQRGALPAEPARATLGGGEDDPPQSAA